MKHQIKNDSAVKKWFESELMQRGIDATIHLEYIMTLAEVCCDDCISVKDIDSIGLSTPNVKTDIDAHWNVSENRDLAVKMLQSLSCSVCILNDYLLSF